jgi:hypothetical protein
MLSSLLGGHCQNPPSRFFGVEAHLQLCRFFGPNEEQIDFAASFDTGLRSGGLYYLRFVECKRVSSFLIVRTYKPKESASEGHFGPWMNISAATNDLASVCSVRTFDQYKRLYLDLLERKEVMLTDHMKLFIQASGTEISQATIKATMHNVLQDAGLTRGFAPHSTRGASLSQVAWNGMPAQSAQEYVHVSQATAAEHYRRLLLASKDTLHPLPPSPCYSDYVRRRMYIELDYTDDGVVLNPAPDTTTDDEG